LSIKESTCDQRWNFGLEANPRYVPLTDAIFAWVERDDSKAVACTIAMMELLVHPYRKMDQQMVESHYGLLSTYPNLKWIAPDLGIADLAACIRGLHNLKTPDALHAATAIRSGATGLITNDPAFERVDSYETLILDRLL
jgi:predicted nucleic acid-binding protein